VAASVTIECDQDENDLTLTGDVSDEADNCSTGLDATFTDSVADGTCANESVIMRTWSLTDECGNTTTADQTITIQDTTAPELVTDIEGEIAVICTDIPEVPELVFEDACSNDITVSFEETTTQSEVIQDYIITREWTVSDVCGNEAVYTQTINVTVKAQIELINTELCIEDTEVDLFDYLDDDTDMSGTWEVISGDATLDGSFFDPASVDELGDYVFRYTSSEGDCFTQIELTITINDDCVVLDCGQDDVIISKAVTPNGDLINDTFTVTGIEACGFIVDIQIFNRWGAVVYKNSNYQNDWDGSSVKSSIGNSNKVPTGTYYYVINLKNSGLQPFAGPIYIATK
jgi:gliding motility-associated-like protein